MTPARRHASASWAPLVLGFALYVAFFVAGFFLDDPALNVVGGLAMICFALIGNYRSMLHLERDAPTRWAFLVMAAFCVTLALNPTADSASITLKYGLVFVLFIRVHSSGLPPLTSTRWRLALLVICGVLLLFSVAFGRAFLLGDESRLSGVFRNPNNLALMALGLLFLVDEKDRPLYQLAVHAMVIGVLVVTYTSGAILSYAAGLLFRYRHRLLRLQGVAMIAVLLAAIAVAGLNVAAPERIKNQIEVVELNLDVALKSDVEYGDLTEEYGDSATSGLWRIAMWSRVARGYVAAKPLELLFGAGLGTSVERYGNHPHNEYLRLIAETGAVGLFAFLGFFAVVIRALRPEDRHLPLIFLMYSLTENNLDNFVFMTLFVLFIGAAVRVHSAPRRRGAPRAGVRDFGRRGLVGTGATAQ